MLVTLLFAAYINKSRDKLEENITSGYKSSQTNLKYKLLLFSSDLNNIARSTHFKRFINSEKIVQDFTSNLIYSEFHNLNEKHPYLSSWTILKYHDGSMTTLLSNKHLDKKYEAFSKTWSIKDNEIIYVQPIKLDDSNQNSESSELKGYIKTEIDKKILIKDIQLISSINNIPQNIQDEEINIEIRKQGDLDLGYTIILFLLLIFATIFSILLSFSKLNESLFVPLKNLSLKLTSKSRNTLRTVSNSSNEIEQLNSLIDEYESVIVEKQKIQSEKEKVEASQRLAKQVSHDIKSPLSVLNTVIKKYVNSDLNEISLLRHVTYRISNISKSLDEYSGNTDQKFSKVNILKSIQNIISEKEVQKQSMNCCNIDFVIENKIPLSLHSYINQNHFSRILSNVINNSIESITSHGTIKINIQSDKSSVFIIIKDNGKGIPGDILPSIFKEGFTYGKQNGNGLGLYHAKQTINSWGGEMSVDSIMDQGTITTIKVPRTNPPETFTDHINIMNSTDIYIIDDDLGIHELWKEGLKDIDIKKHYLNKLSSLEKLIPNINSRKSLFLFDYEFNNEKETGLEIIDKHSLSERSYLITSRNSEDEIQQKCELLKIPLIDKSLIPYITIQQGPHEPPSKLLLDDDELIHMTWKMKAKEANVDLLCFKDPEEIDLGTISKDSVFYIDSNLGDDVKGEDFARKLYDQGFENLYLATGYDKSEFEHLDFLKGVIGKRPPF